MPQDLTKIILNLVDEFKKHPQLKSAIGHEALILRCVDAARGGTTMSLDKWSKTPPTEQGSYWHWDMDNDNAPFILSVLSSGTTGKCFISVCNYGVNGPIWCENYGGFWMAIPEPSVEVINYKEQ